MLEEKSELGAIDLLSETTFANLFDIESEIERLKEEERLIEIARQLGVITAFRKRLTAYRKEYMKFIKDTNKDNVVQSNFYLARNDKQAIKNCIENYIAILKNDEVFKDKLLFNELSGEPEKLVNGKIEPWTDVDDSNARGYIEQRYTIYGEKKLNDALNIVFNENSYNPVKDIIEAIEWDGTSRIQTILSKWLGVVNDAYTREVSRLIFAGGIHRLYNPGCKFDDMPVLIGTKQGEGKSSFVNWLALKDDFFREVKEIEGQKGLEILQGAWICEMGELLALTKAKEVEAVKAYITCRTDVYRKAYGRRVTKMPRHCIFIGTTNKAEFLTDKTGNRRFYPVTVNCTGYYLHEHKEEIIADIRQCWAEALTLYRKGKLKPFADAELIDEIRKRQDGAVEDDYRVGMIEKYLEDKQEVCVLEIWRKALYNEYSSPTRKDSCDIALILSKLDGWKKGTGSRRFLAYGPQKFWERVEEDDDPLPF